MIVEKQRLGLESKALSVLKKSRLGGKPRSSCLGIELLNGRTRLSGAPSNGHEAPVQFSEERNLDHRRLVDGPPDVDPGNRLTHAIKGPPGFRRVRTQPKVINLV